MASLQEFPRALRVTGTFPFFKSVYEDIRDDNLFVLAAAVAYAWLLALFPFLIFLLTMLSHIPDAQKLRARDQIAAGVERVMAQDAAQTITSNLDQLLNQPRPALLSIGVVVTLWVASGGMSMTMSALDSAYEVRSTRPFYTQRPLAILLTIVLTTLILLVFLLIPIGTAATTWFYHQGVPEKLLWKLTFIRYVVAILILFLILSLLYKFGISNRQRFSFISPGAVFTVLVWAGMAFGLRAYVDRFGHYQQTYGALGGVAIVLLVFYIDALMLLIGAEINYQVETVLRRRGKRRSKNEARPES